MGRCNYKNVQTNVGEIERAEQVTDLTSITVNCSEDNKMRVGQGRVGVESGAGVITRAGWQDIRGNNMTASPLSYLLVQSPVWAGAAGG